MTDERRRTAHFDETDPLAVHLRYLREDIDNCVTRTEFEPVKRLMYGLVSLVLVAVVGALLFLVIR